MKKVALFIVLICSMIACRTRDFRIAGFYEGSQECKIVLFTRTNGSVDTLAFADVINGRFELRGRVDGAKVVCLEVVKAWSDEVKASKDFILENKDYMAYLSFQKDHCDIVENTDARILASKFYRNEKQLVDGKEFLFKVYLEATEVERDSVGIQFLKLIDEYLSLIHI